LRVKRGRRTDAIFADVLFACATILGLYVVNKDEYNVINNGNA